MLELLNERRIKRIILLSDGRTAIVEVPVENMESDFENIYVDRREPRWVLAQSGRNHMLVRCCWQLELPLAGVAQRRQDNVRLLHRCRGRSSGPHPRCGCAAGARARAARR